MTGWRVATGVHGAVDCRAGGRGSASSRHEWGGASPVWRLPARIGGA
ncbi:hypothetical protein trd_A0167 (plasmid) [Thermomicrobium roseum DSM 5159]|uniref:Uncharacterized protein n=1 Tax=Thermomicrobium roseum (strain ATCC 27502 / DSM 5159 / P-2) TaxID=309801 RepID=B9L303_THERP|nr:hypothetical protein trd_A0167 [Thermomicrobium roseum DSM 5159]